MRGRIFLDIARRRNAKTVTKGKTMISEEIGLNAFLEENGIMPVETDLGEYIIQLRGEHPSHIIAPAVHVTRDQVEADFRRVHVDLDPNRNLAEPETLLCEARQILRSKYAEADIGVTGANFLIAETGSSVIVTNEGNGDLTQLLGKCHVVLASIEKLVPTLEDTAQILRILARSATGQDMSVYTTLSTGPKRDADLGRAGGIPRHPPRQRPLQHARHRVRGDAALHPLRRLHEPLPGLSRRRRPLLWLGLSRPDGRGADAVADRRRQVRPSAQRLDLLRALRKRLPDAHSAAEDDAALAREGVREPSAAAGRQRTGLDVWAYLRPAAEALPGGGVVRRCRC